MAERRTLEELIEIAREEARQKENRVKALLQRQKEQERKARTKRLIERGAMLESRIEGAETLTNDQIGMLNFLTANNIKDMAGLRDKVGELHARRTDMGGRLNRIDRRVKTLDEHLKQAGYYRQHREVFRQYQGITKPKQREQFYEDHQAEIALYEAAKRYLDGVMNGRTSLPVKAWRDERGRLADERNALNREYVSLKAEVQAVERIRRAAASIMREEQPVRRIRELAV